MRPSATRSFTQGRIVRSGVIPQGSTIWYLDTCMLYDGNYVVEVGNGSDRQRVKVVVAH